jgi:glycosyltransferase involved in cell wall biosynthesis
MKTIELSVIIPVYNSANRIRLLVERLQNALNDVSYEIVLVNDGSKDHSEAVCKSLAEEFHHIRFLSLRRNFGEFNAVMCGLNWAKGDFCVMIDDDFQNPPEEILKLLTVARKRTRILSQSGKQICKLDNELFNRKTQKSVFVELQTDSERGGSRNY